MKLYEYALVLARQADSRSSITFSAAKQAFEACILACPTFEKPWVSYAQMEKRCGASTEERVRRCKEVLQRALALNPHSPYIMQAWGLLELQRGNLLPAVRLLERCVAAKPELVPVLKWKSVQEARRTVGSRGRRQSAV